jgi:hypothetical protein
MSSGWALQFASAELRSDREIVLEAVKYDRKVLKYASKALVFDPTFLLELGVIK